MASDLDLQELLFMFLISREKDHKQALCLIKTLRELLGQWLDSSWRVLLSRGSASVITTKWLHIKIYKRLLGKELINIEAISIVWHHTEPLTEPQNIGLLNY